MGKFRANQLEGHVDHWGHYLRSATTPNCRLVHIISNGMPKGFDGRINRRSYSNVWFLRGTQGSLCMALTISPHPRHLARQIVQGKTSPPSIHLVATC